MVVIVVVIMAGCSGVCVWMESACLFGKLSGADISFRWQPQLAEST